MPPFCTYGDTKLGHEDGEMTLPSIRALAVSGLAPYLSVTEVTHDIESL